MKYLILATTWIGASAFGCSCINTSTPCSAMSGSETVFVGRVLVDSGEGWGKGPALVAIEEPLLNVAEGLKEVSVQTMAGTSCYQRLKAGERYVIFASASTDNPNTFLSGGCSHTFNVEGKEHVLAALRRQARGGSSTIAGRVGKKTGTYSAEQGVAGALVVAFSSTVRREALSDAFGRYEITGLPPDRYKFEVQKPDSRRTTNTILGGPAGWFVIRRRT